MFTAGTFYLASSSHPDVLDGVEEKIQQLLRLGYRWPGDYDWTHSVRDSIVGKQEYQFRTVIDLTNVLAADLFVLVVQPKFSFGSSAEYGTRVSHHKAAHVVLNGQEMHCFLHHPCAIVHQTWQDFINYIGGLTGRPPGIEIHKA